MKKQLLFLLITILSFNSYSQITFEKGYYIDNTDQKINCLIRNIDWKNNPTEFEYKLSENDVTEKATIASVKEFGVYNISKYVRSIVNIDRSSENLNILSKEKNPIFKEEELFLKVLVEGKASLYQYYDSNLKRYFYNKDDSDIEQLVFKSYRTSDNNIGKNESFKGQLWDDLKCSNFKISKVESMGYTKSELVNFFVAYNTCNDEKYVNFEEKQERDLFNLTIRPRINSSSLKMKNSAVDSRDTNFDNEISFGFGMETEFILPFNKNKWSLTIEPTFQSYKSEKTTANLNNVSGGVLIANVDYSSIEIPMGLRHYFFLNDKSKIFIDASYVFDFDFDSSIEFTRNDGSSIESLEIETRNNLALGVGYKHNDRYSLELRYQMAREILSEYSFWGSDYQTFSMVIGYSIF